MEEDTLIRPATAADADALAEFAERMFDEAFGADCDEGDMAAYLTEAFGPEKQRAEISEPGAIILLAEDARSKALVGYLHAARATPPGSVSGDAPVELKRLYVDRSRQGSGLAKKLLDMGIERAKAAGARTMWLGVWENNHRAQRFYAREGFTRAGEQPFQIGSDTQTDFVLSRPLS